MDLLSYRNEFDGNATKQTFIGKLLRGTIEVYCCGYCSQSGDRASAYWPHTAYFCRQCGEVWCREIYIYKFNYQPLIDNPWEVVSKPCPKHGDYFLFDLPIEGLAIDTLRQIFNGLLAHYLSQGVGNE